MPEYKFPHIHPHNPEHPLNIFRFKRPQADQSAVRAIAERFQFHLGTNHGTWCQNPTTVRYTEGALELVAHLESGGWRYRDTARWQVDDGRSHVELSDAAAVAIAQKHMDRLELAAPKEREVFSVTRLHVGVAEQGTGYSEERVIDVCVRFVRMVDGLPVEGQGGKILLYLDGAGEITAIDHIWREIQDVYRPVERLRSPEDALRDVERAWGKHGTGRVQVEAVRLSYFEDGWDVSQPYLQPMYVMPLKISSHEGRFVAGSEHVVPAAMESVETGVYTRSHDLVPPSHPVRQWTDSLK